ncbi:MAG: hypothetical protein IJV00_02550 [Clostridia bacterium]|nr:hypothetical protein [Clostridia bacterium]
MFVHIGSGVSLDGESVVMIVDLEGESTSVQTTEYMKKMSRLGRVRTVGDELPRTLVITYDQKNGQLCYVSPISARTLKERIDEGEVIRNWKRS